MCVVLIVVVCLSVVVVLFDPRGRTRCSLNEFLVLHCHLSRADRRIFETFGSDIPHDSEDREKYYFYGNKRDNQQREMFSF